jgi:hypothetical protein
MMVQQQLAAGPAYLFHMAAAYKCFPLHTAAPWLMLYSQIQSSNAKGAAYKMA